MTKQSDHEDRCETCLHRPDIAHSPCDDNPAPSSLEGAGWEEALDIFHKAKQYPNGFLHLSDIKSFIRSQLKQTVERLREGMTSVIQPEGHDNCVEKTSNGFDPCDKCDLRRGMVNVLEAFDKVALEMGIIKE